jgi:hypothetical protein
MENPGLVMFAQRHAGLSPVVFLLVISVVAMILLAEAIFLWDPLLAWVESAPTLSCLTYIAVCAFSPWPCLYVKRRYDEAYGYDRELRRLLGREGLTVEVVRVTGLPPQRAEVYVEGATGLSCFHRLHAQCLHARGGLAAGTGRYGRRVPRRAT